MSNPDWNIVIVPNGDKLLTQHLGITKEGAIEALAEVLSVYLAQEGRKALLIEPRVLAEVMTAESTMSEEARAAFLEAGGNMPGAKYQEP